MKVHGTCANRFHGLLLCDSFLLYMQFIQIIRKVYLIDNA